MGWEGGEEAGTGHHIAPLGSRSQPDSQQRASSVPFSKRFPAEIPRGGGGKPEMRVPPAESGAAVWRKAVKTRGSEVVLPPALSLLSTLSRSLEWASCSLPGTG